MNHYPHHIGDFLKKTIALSMVEEGAYRRLLDIYYDSERPLPDDLDEICNATRCRTPADRRAVAMILGRYFTHEPGIGYRHSRCDEEIAAYQTRAETARSNGRKGGRPGSIPVTESVISGFDSANRVASQKKTNPEPKPEPEPEPIPTLPSEAPVERARKRATQLAYGWQLPEEWQAWAIAERPGWTPADAVRVSLLFRDHWRSKGEARADWLATWRNWVRRERAQLAAVPTKETERARVAREMFGGVIDERNRSAADRDITGEATRVA